MREQTIKAVTVKPVLSSHSKIHVDKAKILMTNGSLMKVKRIAECSHWISMLSGRLRLVSLLLAGNGFKARPVRLPKYQTHGIGTY